MYTLSIHLAQYCSSTLPYIAVSNVFILQVVLFLLNTYFNRPFKAVCLPYCFLWTMNYCLPKQINMIIISKNMTVRAGLGTCSQFYFQPATVMAAVMHTVMPYVMAAVMPAMMRSVMPAILLDIMRAVMPAIMLISCVPSFLPSCFSSCLP